MAALAVGARELANQFRLTALPVRCTYTWQWCAVRKQFRGMPIDAAELATVARRGGGGNLGMRERVAYPENIISKGRNQVGNRILVAL